MNDLDRCDVLLAMMRAEYEAERTLHERTAAMVIAANEYAGRLMKERDALRAKVAAMEAVVSAAAAWAEATKETLYIEGGPIRECEKRLYEAITTRSAGGE